MLRYAYGYISGFKEVSATPEERFLVVRTGGFFSTEYSLSYLEKHDAAMIGSVMEVVSVLVHSKELTDYIEKNRSRLEKEGGTMCQAITELIEDGRQEGMDYINIMYSKLKAAGRNDDLYRSIDDPEYQRKLLHEFFPDKFSEKKKVMV